MDRRTALSILGTASIGGLVSAVTGGLSLFGALKSAYAAEKTDLFLEGWILAAPEGDSNQRQGLLGQVVRASKFEHLYLKLNRPQGAVYFHGFPTNTQTGEIGNYGQGRTQLFVYAMTAQESEERRAAHGRDILAPQKIHGAWAAYPTPIEATPVALVVAEILDQAAAINAAQIPYVAARVSPPPTNSNAAAAALLYAVSACPAGACPQLEAIYPTSFAPGINAGLAQQYPAGRAYRQMAQSGVSTDDLLAKFRATRPAQKQTPGGAIRIQSPGIAPAPGQST